MRPPNSLNWILVFRMIHRALNYIHKMDVSPKGHNNFSTSSFEAPRYRMTFVVWNPVHFHSFEFSLFLRRSLQLDWSPVDLEVDFLWSKHRIPSTMISPLYCLQALVECEGDEGRHVHEDVRREHRHEPWLQGFCTAPNEIDRCGQDHRPNAMGELQRTSKQNGAPKRLCLAF